MIFKRVKKIFDYSFLKTNTYREIRSELFQTSLMGDYRVLLCIY